MNEYQGRTTSERVEEALMGCIKALLSKSMYCALLEMWSSKRYLKYKTT